MNNKNAAKQIDLGEKIEILVKGAGFDLVGVAKAEVFDKEGKLLDENIGKGYYGNMKWLEETAEKRKDIFKVMPEAKSVICVALNYHSSEDKERKNKSQGQIARYAYGRDYHKIFDKKLKLFSQKLKDIFPDGDFTPSLEVDKYATENNKFYSNIREPRAEFKYYSDTGPIMDRAFAVRAGLGFIGKNTNLITKYGSWVLLGEIITNIEFDCLAEQNFSELQSLIPAVSAAAFSASLFSGADAKLYQKTPSPALGFLNKQMNKKYYFSNISSPRAGPSKFSCGCSSKQYFDRQKQINSCGSCRRCLDVCPTGALESPYVVNASKCISYLTIEHKGDIPLELRDKMGNWIFGCDMCQEVCPFNIGRQKRGSDFELVDKAIAGSVRDLKEILSIKTDEEFLKKFAGSPVMRAKRRGLVRNACVAAGNSGDKSLLPYLKECLNDSEELIVGHAKWAIEKLEKMIK